MQSIKRAGTLVLGWVLVLAGLAALVLPGPGLLALFAGLALLSQHYGWARKRVEPVKRAAYRTAAEGVQTWPRIVVSVLGVCCLLGLGAVWIWRPASPDWWPLRDDWWLVGGWVAGATLVFSGLVALALVVYSFRNFRGSDDPHGAAEDAAR
jgi:TRAP-type C4-dicarboxylate transport system permease small subunit